MSFYEIRTLHIFFLIGLSFTNLACAKNIIQNCDSNNVSNSLQCIQNENQLFAKKLAALKNNEKKDFKIWENTVKNKCEGKKSYTLGDGAALIREGCYREEYKMRLKLLTQEKKLNINQTKEKNNDGFNLTHLPYNSEDHLNCLLKNNRNSCNKINLISILELSKVYNFIDESNGPSVIFPETENGVILIASPSSSESGKLIINLISLNTLGLTKEVALDAGKKILINKNYEISYTQQGKLTKISMSKNGEFIHK